MKLLVTGGRDYKDWQKVDDLIEYLAPEFLFVGCCPTGVDKFAREAAATYDIPMEVFSADWNKHGRAAGPIRNKLMLDTAPPETIVLVFPGGRGTADCTRQALSMNRFVLEVKA